MTTTIKGSAFFVRPSWACLEAGRHAQHVKGLVEVSRALGTIRDERSLMIAVGTQVAPAFSADRSALYLHDSERRELWTNLARKPEDWPLERRDPDDHGLRGRVFQTHQSLCVADASQEQSTMQYLSDETGYLPCSVLIAPVIEASGRCVGIVEITDRREYLFETADVPLIEAIALQAAISLENASFTEAQRKQFESFVAAMSAALDSRDPLTAIHSINVANYAVGMGEVLGLATEEIQWLRFAGLLHDVGKIGITESVLMKPGRLTSSEFEEMKRHVEISRNILSKIKFMNELQGLDALAAAHHERLDGSGYPDGLRDEQLPQKARILAVADVFDALTQTRHYRQGMTMHEAFKEIGAMTPHQLDTKCVAALKAFLGCGPWPIN